MLHVIIIALRKLFVNRGPVDMGATFPEYLAGNPELWYNCYMEDVIAYCTKCRSDLGSDHLHICDGSLDNMFIRSDKIDRALVFPTNVLLLNSDRSVGRLYDDDNGVRLVQDAS